MEAHFLNDWVEQLEKEGCETCVKPVGTPWYNPYGDCIQFLTVDQAYVGDRIDEYLTIFRAHDDGRAIGYMLKGVESLLNRTGADGLHVRTAMHGDEVVSIRASLLLFMAFSTDPSNVVRMRKYAEAADMKQPEVEIPVRAA